jgi:hypothetical protein
MWSVFELANAIAAGLSAEEKRLAAEQAPSGLDALDELGLQPLLARAMEQAVYGVHREQRYPACRHQRNASEGERCDLVLTPNGRPLKRPEEPPTLFDPPDAVALEDAFWLELKVVAQFTPRGPNRGYSAQLLGPITRDVGKLCTQNGIRHAGLLIILFAQDDTIAEHDLELWRSRAVERGLPVGSPELRSIAITDRLGNALCKLGLYPVWPESRVADG